LIEVKNRLPLAVCDSLFVCAAEFITLDKTSGNLFTILDTPSLHNEPGEHNQAGQPNALASIINHSNENVKHINEKK
jgi:hypothetical protein